MKRLEIERSPTGDQGTFGRFALPWASWARCSLELPWRDNHRGHSCIPEWSGIARLRPSTKWSPRGDGRLYGLVDVPGRDSILIHAATWAGDTELGWKADLLGCIAPGGRTGTLKPEGYPNPQACIFDSRKALTEFMALTEGEDLEVVVRWAPGAAPAVVA